MSSLSLKCGSCDAEMVQSFKKNEQGRNVCAWTCPCGVAKPKCDGPATILDSFRYITESWEQFEQTFFLPEHVKHDKK